ncbi:hypothetical protein Veis_1208 [Verminephrobacter eiseniae EF01-2]|uniref:Uncharacterized protein n=1 Tax=Verminephrobacter eiseniae (strain EF01-2) TaxID=391735 RepID=A1WH72_VEREI|nr:hypothetical protein Veis_1208 [Verminephrobacter eiseniae EF01-2]MCW5287320.1 hypothetical protein [Verminephrobacter eiseniae]MCW5305619.1 hypothetical protein [Verminephrobacter eiseniae]MCW8179266.1 hypothetical protein [Verminephrobacter eiseniae]MCW8188575.1 hypothetical protein [Verminephrobacter eiseniae]
MSAPWIDRKQPEVFCATLGMRTACSVMLVGQGHSRIVHEVPDSTKRVSPSLLWQTAQCSGGAWVMTTPGLTTWRQDTALVALAPADRSSLALQNDLGLLGPSLEGSLLEFWLFRWHLACNSLIGIC